MIKRRSHTARVGGDGEKREPIDYKRWGRGDTRRPQLKEYLVVAAAAMLCRCCARIAAPLRPTRDTERREGQRDSRTDVGVSPFFCLCLSRCAHPCYLLLPCALGARSPWRPDISTSLRRGEEGKRTFSMRVFPLLHSTPSSCPPSRHHHQYPLPPPLRACTSVFMLSHLPFPLLV